MSTKKAIPRRFSDAQVAAAKEYIAAQLVIMEHYGGAPTLSPERYAALVEDVLHALPLSSDERVRRNAWMKR